MEKVQFRIITVLLLSITAFITDPSYAAKNVVLMIGDGMGPASVVVAKYYSELILGRDLGMQVIMDMGNTGYMVNLSSSGLVTDSAASATAMATGVKTTNGALGVDVDGIVLESVLERAQKLGKRVGLVTTDTIVGATPSGFGAHVVSRKMKDKIPEQFLAKKINVLFGGGAESFKAKEGGSDKIQDFINAGYIVARTKDELNKINAGKVALALGLFSEKEVDYYQTRASTVPSLVDMTIKALEILSRDEDGFFLMIEGARIDHAAHINDAKRLVDELLEFDNTISVVEQYIKRNPDTLLIVTADHETGSPVFDYPYKYKKPEELEELKQLKNIHWIGKEHTSAPLMLFGIGPGAEQLRGMHDNTCVANIIFQALSQAGGTKTGGK